MLIWIDQSIRFDFSQLSQLVLLCGRERIQSTHSITFCVYILSNTISVAAKEVCEGAEFWKGQRVIELVSFLIIIIIIGIFFEVIDY